MNSDARCLGLKYYREMFLLEYDSDYINPDILEKRCPYPFATDNFCSGYTFQINADIRRDARISLRILFKFFFAPVTAEIIHLVPVHTGKFCIFLINYHKTDGICCHRSLPLYCYQYQHIPLSVIAFSVH
jgi:hypothetical protein